MALVIGNKTQANPFPASDTYTFAHNQNAGAGGFLMVAVVMSNSTDFDGATYNGVAMTEIISSNMGSLAQRMIIYGLQDPATGSNDVVLNFIATQFNPISVFAVSFTGSGGAGNSAHNGLLATPNSQTLNVSENSVIYAFGVSVNTVTDITIDGSLRPDEFSHNTNRIVVGALSLTELNAGSIDVDVEAAFGDVTNTRIEITEAAGIVEGSFLLMM